MHQETVLKIRVHFHLLEEKYRIRESITYFQSHFTEIYVPKTSEGQRPFYFSSKKHSSSIPKHSFSITTRTSRYSIEISFFTNICQPVEWSTQYLYISTSTTWGWNLRKMIVVYRTTENSYILSRGESSKVSISTAFNCNLTPTDGRNK